MLIVLQIRLGEDRKIIFPRNQTPVLPTASHFDSGLSLFLLLDLHTFQNPYPSKRQDDKISQMNVLKERCEPLKLEWYNRP